MLLPMLLPTFLVLTGSGGFHAVSAERAPLHIGALLPLSEKDGWSRFFGFSALVGAQRAVTDINNRSDILPNYTLVLHVADTEGSLPVALNRLYEFIYKPPVKVAIFGSMLSSLTETVAEVIGKWNIVEMSPGASTPVLSQRDKYPHTFRMITSAAGFSYAQVELFRLFGWNKIATLHQTKEPHVGTINKLQDLVSESNYTIIVAETFYKDPGNALQRLKEKDVRIIATSFYEEAVWKVFCCIYQLGMYGPNYVWMLPGYFSDGWWMKESAGVECTPEQLKAASEGYLTITYSMYGMGDEEGIGGTTPREFREEISDEFGYPVTVTNRGSGAMGYDGIWALALAMADAQADLAGRLDSYQYGDSEYARAIGRSIYRLDFAGMSGPVRFNQPDGDRIGNLLIEQHINGQEEIVGTYDSITNRVIWDVPSQDLWYYSGGEPPFDADITETIMTLQGSPLSLIVVTSVLAALGIVFALMFLLFNIWKRSNKQIKMSSPKVNNVIACGIMLAYLSVALLGIDCSMVEKHALLSICRVRSWFIPIAFTLAFGGMFTKMWRVYSIVIGNKTKRKVIKDYYLFGIIGVMLLVDFAILIPWHIIDPIHIEENIVAIPQTQRDLDNHEKRVDLYVICTSTNNTIWTLVFIIYKAFVVVIGAFLAWSTRNIQVSGLNDSNYVGMSIYNTVICCVVAVPLSVLNVSSTTVTFALVSGFLLLCITVSLCMLFIPKVVAVYRKNSVSNETFTGVRFGTRVGAPRSEVPTTSAVVESCRTTGET